MSLLLISLIVSFVAAKCVVSFRETYEDRECSDLKMRVSKYDPLMICIGDKMRQCTTGLGCKDCQMEYGLYKMAKTYDVNYSSKDLSYTENSVYVVATDFPNITYNITGAGKVYSDKLAIGYYKKCSLVVNDNKKIDELCYPLEFRILRYLDVKYVYENSLALWPVINKYNMTHDKIDYIVLRIQGGLATGTKIGKNMNTRYCCMVSVVPITSQNAKNKEEAKRLCCGMKKCNCSGGYIENIPELPSKPPKIVKQPQRMPMKTKHIEVQISYPLFTIAAACGIVWWFIVLSVWTRYDNVAEVEIKHSLD